MSGGKKSFLLHIDSLDILDDLTDEQAGQLFKAIKSYQKKEEVMLNSLVKMAFLPFKNQFARDDEKYDLTCKRRAEAGRKGGEAKASKSQQTIANASKCQQDLANLADNKNKNKNKNKNDNKRSMPSKLDLVQDVFNYWCKVMDKPINTTKLTPKRQQKIQDRLAQGYTVDDIKCAIDGCRDDPFSMGQNDRCKKYNDIELICRIGEKLEFFMETADATIQPQLSTAQKMAAEFERKYGAAPADLDFR